MELPLFFTSNGKKRMRKLLLVGLGNPEKKYEKTRHNIGFEVVRHFISAHREAFSLKKDLKLSDITVHKKKNIQGSVFEGAVNGVRIFALFPLTYMNDSGMSVKKAIEVFGISPLDILVVQDDKDMLFGKIRFVQADKESRSGGHNGIASMIERLGTTQFSRLKIGVANSMLNTGVDTAKFVLLSFIPQEKKLLPAVIERAAHEIETHL